MTNQHSAANSTVNVTALGERLAGKYLTFKLGDEEYGVEIRKVREIIPMQRITRIPRAPAYVRGVINLRGRVIPVIDLRTAFGMEQHEDTERTCIVVAELETMDRLTIMGAVIDEVREVANIQAGDVQEAPEFEAGVDTRFITGIAQTGDTVRILLNIDRILNSGEIEKVEETAKAAR